MELNPPGVEYRKMVRSDALSVFEIDKGNIGSWGLRDYVQMTRPRVGYGIVAEFSGQVVGFAVFTKTLLVAEVHRVAVKPYYRRMGIGTGLMNCVENVIDGAQAHVYVHEKEVDMQLFLRKFGMVGRILKDDGRFLLFTRGEPVTIPKGTHRRFKNYEY